LRGVISVRFAKFGSTETYKAEIAAVLPYSDELMTLASRGIFAMQFPDHPVTASYKEVADQLMA
jgi:hypothetical protein